MKTDKKPSIFTDRSGIGSSDELDEYGVWVKSEPEDCIIDEADTFGTTGGDAGFDLDIPENQDSQDGNTNETDESGGFNIDFEDNAPSPDLDFSPLGKKEEQIEETQEIQENIPQITEETKEFDIEIPETQEEIPPTPPSTSKNDANVLSNELLLKIADELSTIKNELSVLKRDFSEIRGGVKRSQDTEAPSVEKEAAAPLSSIFDDGDQDDTIALTGDELTQIVSNAEVEIVPAPEIPLPEEDFVVEEAAQEEPVEEPIVEETIAGEPVIADAEAPEAQESGIISFDEGLNEIPGLSQPETEAIASDELDAVLNSIDSAETDAAALPPTGENDSGEANAEISLDLDLEDESAETEQNETFDDIFKTEGTENETLEIEMPAADEAVLTEPVEAAPEIPLADESALTEPVTDSSEIAESNVEAESAPETFDIDDLNIDTETVTAESSAAGEVEIPEEPIEMPPSASPPQKTEGAVVSPQFKKDVQTVLAYMDQLLEALPEEKIEEFARSEQFEVYKKVFKELGLV